MSRFNLQNLLVVFLCFVTISSFFIDYSQVEQRCRVCFFLNGHFEIVDCFVDILAEFVKQNTHVEVSLKIFRVNCQRSLVELATLDKLILARWLLLFLNALGQ